jgi:hypothetical protein
MHGGASDPARVDLARSVETWIDAEPAYEPYLAACERRGRAEPPVIAGARSP